MFNRLPPSVAVAVLWVIVPPVMVISALLFKQKFINFNRERNYNVTLRGENFAKTETEARHEANYELDKGIELMAKLD